MKENISLWPGNIKESTTLYPIGTVVNAFNESSDWDQKRGETSRIILDPTLVPGLEGLVQRQRLIVLFCFQLVEDFELSQHPKGYTNRPKPGVFTIRSPRRPNPIGMTVVELLAIDQNEIYVRGLDALNGSLVIGIKPA